MQITHYVFPENYPNCSESKSYTISECKLTQMSYITKSPAPKRKKKQNCATSGYYKRLDRVLFSLPKPEKQKAKNVNENEANKLADKETVKLFKARDQFEN